MSDRTIDKTVHPGSIVYPGRENPVPVYCRIQYAEGRLSISGVEGPLSSDNAVGNCGQIEMGYAHRDEADNDSRYSSPKRIARFADGWDEERWFDFLDTWKRWHLNDLRAECEHQRALGWTYATRAGQDCPECGYRIGSAWLREDVPAETVDFLASLPESSRTPAWV